MTTRVARRLGPDGPETVRVDLETGEAAPSDDEPTHWLVGAPLNAHTHIGDAFLTGRVPDGDLASIVAPPDGFKHRMLAQADPDVVVAGIRTALAEYAQAGCRRIVDFREGGVEGIRLLRAALDEALEAPAVTMLGRGDVEEVDRLLAQADGLAYSSIADDVDRDLAWLSRRCHEARGIFAIHLSEGKREDVEAALALEPDMLVHLCKATPADVRRVAEAGIPVVVCPTSNARFGLEPPVATLEATGVEWFVGTDNAMFGSRSVFEEAAWIRAHHPDLPDERLVRAVEAPGAEARWALDAAPEAADILLPLDGSGRVDWTGPARRSASMTRPVS